MHRLWDKIGISISFLCLLHCILLPVIAIAVPSFHHLFGEHDHVHIIFAIIIWPTALLAFLPAYKHHKKLWIPGLAAIGLMLITSSVLAHDHFSETITITLSIVGSVFLVYGHYQNFICNRCNHCHGDENKVHIDGKINL